MTNDKAGSENKEIYIRTGKEVLRKYVIATGRLEGTYPIFVKLSVSKARHGN
jgi:hypothetical protein